MKMRIVVTALCLFLFQSIPIQSAEELSCEELGEISDTLSELTDLITDISDKVEEGSDIDKALGMMIKELQKVAKAEDSERLSTAIKALHEAWKDEDGQWEQFPAAMAITTYEFDRIYYNEGCEKNSEDEYTQSELKDLVYTLRQLDQAIEAKIEIKDGSHLDIAFEGLLNDLKELVDATENNDLKKQVRTLQKAWTDSDWEAFAEVCDVVADAVEEL